MIEENGVTLKEKIKEKYETLPKGEKLVARFVLDHYKESVMMSTQELAEMTGVSDTTVIRYAKSLGFKGFLDYKKAIRREYTSYQKVYSYLKLMDKPANGSFIPNYLQSLKEDVSYFIDKIDYSVLDKIAKSILSAKTVYLLGMGSDIVISGFLINYLKIMGIPCIAINEVGLTLKEGLFLLDPKDLVVMAAFPTLMEDEKWVANWCKQKGTPIIALTDSEMTATILGSKHSYTMSEKIDLFFNSYVLAMIFCNLLLIRIQELAPEKIESSLSDYQKMMTEGFTE